MAVAGAALDAKALLLESVFKAADNATQAIERQKNATCASPEGDRSKDINRVCSLLVQAQNCRAWTTPDFISKNVGPLDPSLMYKFIKHHKEVEDLPVPSNASREQLQSISRRYSALAETVNGCIATVKA